MSANGAERTNIRPAEWDRLELSVRRLLDEHGTWRRRAQAAEQRVRELEATLADLSSGRMDPVKLEERAEAFERENRALHERLAQARETVERIAARFQFAEDDK
jgi:predicted RNase H-like nuclease (RuvC/YqgF family)